MRIKKSIVYILGLMVIFLFGAISSFGAPTITIDTYTTINTTTQNISMTIAHGEEDGWNITNVTVVVSGCGSGSCGYNATKDGGDTNVTIWNCSINTMGFSDETLCTLTATAYNVTTASFTDTETAYPDNTVPDCTLSSGISAGTIVDKKDTNVSYTCSNTSSATIYFGGNAYSMTESSDSCGYDISNIPDSSYDVYISCSDGTTTASSSVTNGVTLKGDRKYRGPLAGVDEVVSTEMDAKRLGIKDSSPLVWVAILAAIWFVFFHGDKKKLKFK